MDDAPLLCAPGDRSLKHTERRHLRARQKAELASAMTAVLTDPDADIETELKRLKTVERLLAIETTGPTQRRTLAIIIGLVCVTIVGLAQVIRMPASRVTLFVEAESATFGVVDDWLWGTPVSRTTQILIDGFEDVELPSSVAAKLNNEPDDVFDITGDKLTLASLAVGAGGGVTIESSANTTDLFMRGAPVNGELTLSGALTVGSGSNSVGGEWSSGTFQFTFPEIVTFAASPNRAVPVHMQVSHDREIKIENVSVQALSFAREQVSSTGGAGFESTITSGRLTISETGEDVALNRGDHIEIGDATEARIIELSINGKVNIAFEGKAKVVSMVKAGRRIDLRPTVLEYIYHNELLVFLWSALGICWGLVWSVRRTVL